MSLYYTQKLEEAIQAVGDGGMSICHAAEQFGVPKSTLQNRMKGTHKDVHGRPTVLSKEEEKYIEEKCIEEMVLQCAHWGFPFTQMDLQMFVKQYRAWTRKDTSPEL